MGDVKEQQKALEELRQALEVGVSAEHSFGWPLTVEKLPGFEEAATPEVLELVRRGRDGKPDGQAVAFCMKCQWPVKPWYGEAVAYLLERVLPCVQRVYAVTCF